MTKMVDPYEAGDKERQRERRVAYLECQRRGHTDTGVVLTSNPPWSVCKFCGTQYRSEVRIIEQKVPQRVLCRLEHDKGVACPNEPECPWGD